MPLSLIHPGTRVNVIVQKPVLTGRVWQPFGRDAASVQRENVSFPRNGEPGVTALTWLKKKREVCWIEKLLCGEERRALVLQSTCWDAQAQALNAGALTGRSAIWQDKKAALYPASPAPWWVSIKEMDLDERSARLQVHSLEKAGRLDGATRCAIQLERGRRGIRSAPGPVEAKVDIGARSNCSIIRKVCGAHIPS